LRRGWVGYGGITIGVMPYFLTNLSRDLIFMVINSKLKYVLLLPIFSSIVVIAEEVISEVEQPLAEHCTQSEINAISDPNERFVFTFECGQRLFATRFNSLDGGGANVGDGNLYTGIPRADLNGAGEWANHVPQRRNGPDGEACVLCHAEPITGSGANALNIVLDPLNNANVSEFFTRNTTSLLGGGALQLLAEEMTANIIGDRERARRVACRFRQPVSVPLIAKRVSFGSIRVACDPAEDINSIVGVDDDLIIRPFGWKGIQASMRGFNQGAAHNDIGMQAVEVVGADVDGDFDGVTNELFVGDMTGLAVYQTAQARPVSRLELADLGLLEELGFDALQPGQRDSINRGQATFNDIGCDSCHVPSLTLNNTVFNEPSLNETHRDETFPSGDSPESLGVSPDNPVSFDLTKDIIDNRFIVDGREVALGNLDVDSRGRGVVRLYGDLKRHDMGPELAESVDDAGVAASVFLTKELWGVGSNGPYLSNGAAGTITEAIIAHGGESTNERDNFVSLSASSQADVIEFLENLLLVQVTPED